MNPRSGLAKSSLDGLYTILIVAGGVTAAVAALVGVGDVWIAVDVEIGVPLGIGDVGNVWDAATGVNILNANLVVLP